MTKKKVIITFIQVTATDFGDLSDLRIEAMRESLERVGRFNPERARERLRATFAPEHTYFINFGDVTVGFYSACPCPEGLRLDHLYVHPAYQNRGIGSVTLGKIFADADRDAVPVLVGALRESDSNQFYQRHGFTKVSETEWDIYYARPSEAD